MVPTPGDALDQLNLMVTDPLFLIVARLAKGPTGIDNDTFILSDMVEADFPGYAPIPLTANLSQAFEKAGYGELSPQALEWIVGAIVTPQTITHVYYTKTYNGGGQSLVAAVAFDNPISLTIPGQAVQFTATIMAVNVDA